MENNQNTIIKPGCGLHKKETNYMTISKAVEIINSRTICIPGSVQGTTKGDDVFLAINEVTLKNDKIVFGRENCMDTVTLNAEYVTAVHMEDGTVDFGTVHFQLTNGEKWFVSLCGVERIPRKFREDIDIDDFLDKIQQSEIQSVQFKDQYVGCHYRFNEVAIEDTDFDPDWNEDREVTITLKQGEDSFKFTLNDNSKFEFAESGEGYDAINVSLEDMPFSTFMVILYYKK